MGETKPSVIMVESIRRSTLKCIRNSPETEQPADNVVAHEFMKTLKAGDVRQEGDQVRSKDVRIGFLGGGSTSTSILTPGSWKDVNLIGWPILFSDLMHAEFRRP